MIRIPDYQHYISKEASENRIASAFAYTRLGMNGFEGCDQRRDPNLRLNGGNFDGQAGPVERISEDVMLLMGR
ncbi:MAG: hypothetical protein AAF098_19060 [Pseudomonadota bacterium]